MTRLRALKTAVRARAARTGERYTTALRHVRNERETASLAAPAAPPAPPPAVESASAVPRGTVSDAKAREKTGHGLEHWFTTLDAFGGVEKGHTALAKHLYADHGVPGWYAQGITVSYERARGARATNQRTSGDYEVSVTKTVAGTTTDVVRLFTSARRRSVWLAAADPELARALTDALTAKGGKGFVVRDDGMGRFRYKSGRATVQFYLIPKGAARTSVVVTHMKLADSAQLETSRAAWRAALAALARVAAG